MKKYIEIPFEVIDRLSEGKYVEGSLHRDKLTGAITFNYYKRRAPRHRSARVICQLENGWLKESATRIKFYNSVKKDLGRRLVSVVMHRELKTAMNVMEVEEILNNI